MTLEQQKYLETIQARVLEYSKEISCSFDLYQNIKQDDVRVQGSVKINVQYDVSYDDDVQVHYYSEDFEITIIGADELKESNGGMSPDGLCILWGSDNLNVFTEANFWMVAYYNSI
jgi:hypothetical protein